jgi:hypothetical protein
MGVLAFLVVARLVARSSSVVNARSIAAKIHLTMVEVHPTTAGVELTTLDAKLTIVEDDLVTKEFDLVLMHLNFTATELFSADAVLIRQSVHVSYNLKYI